MSHKTNLHILRRWLENRGLKADIQTHPIALEAERTLRECPEQPQIQQLAEQVAEGMPYQLLVTGLRGQISVIRGSFSFSDYEIYCLAGALFDDVCRYGTMREAGMNIHSLLAAGTFAENVRLPPTPRLESDTPEG